MIPHLASISQAVLMKKNLLDKCNELWVAVFLLLSIFIYIEYSHLQFHKESFGEVAERLIAAPC